MALDVPGDRDVAIAVARRHPVPQETRGCCQRAVMTGIIAVIQVDEDLAFRRHQPCELAQCFNPGGGRQNMPKNVPQTRNDVEVALLVVEIFGAYGPDVCLRGANATASM